MMNVEKMLAITYLTLTSILVITLITLLLFLMYYERFGTPFLIDKTITNQPITNVQEIHPVTVVNKTFIKEKLTTEGIQNCMKIESSSETIYRCETINASTI